MLGDKIDDHHDGREDEEKGLCYTADNMNGLVNYH